MAKDKEKKGGCLGKIGIAFIVILVLGAIGMFSGGSEEATEPDPQPQEQQQGTVQEPTPAAPELTSDQKSGHKIIDKFTLAYNAIATTPIEEVTMVNFPRCAAEVNGLYVEMTHPDIPKSYVVVSVYGYANDFDAMKAFFVDAAVASDSAVTAEAAASVFDANIGVEASAELGNLRAVTFSAPNDVEDYYRVDIQTEAFEN